MCVVRDHGLALYVSVCLCLLVRVNVCLCVCCCLCCFVFGCVYVSAVVRVYDFVFMSVFMMRALYVCICVRIWREVCVYMSAMLICVCGVCSFCVCERLRMCVFIFDFEIV